MVTRQWPLIGMIDTGRSMFTVDGAEHRRLRNKTVKPTDDLTTALIFAADGGAPLTEKALVAAGHETTVGLLLNTVRALLGRPEQLRAIRDGDFEWQQAIEETLRWDTPVPIRSCASPPRTSPSAPP
ncbi:hypothetical protein ACQPZ2_10730 [Nocardia pseudovaccinii]|uniref:hypothetical protein n=1 Tax=Nocardia pseudovaccinii TaxID=189540 RepID=UPI003D928AC0